MANYQRNGRLWMPQASGVGPMSAGFGAGGTIVGEIISFLTSIGPSNWWRLGATAVNDGSGHASSVPDSCPPNNTITALTTASHTKPAIGTLSDAVTPALTINGAQSFTPGTAFGAPTSNTFILLGEPVAVPTGFGAIVWGGTSAGATVACTQTGTVGGSGPSDFTNVGGFLCSAPTVTTALQTVEFNFDSPNTVAQVFRNGLQVATA